MNKVKTSDDFPTVLAAILAVAVAATPVMMQPAMVHGMVSFLEFSAADAGAIAFSELAGFLCAAILFAFIGGKIPWRATLFSGGALVVAMHIAGSYLGQSEFFAATRVGAGVGAGFVAAIGWAVLAQSSLVARNFAWATIGILVFSASFFWQIPNIFAAEKYDHFLVVYSACTAVMLFAVFFASGFNRDANADDQSPEIRSLPVFTFVGALSAAAILIFHLGYMAAYTYMVLIGEANGLSGDEEVANALALSQFAGIAGAFAVALLVGKVDYLRMTIVISIVGAVGISAFALDLTYSKFLGLNMLFQFCWAAGMPLILGMIVLGDRTGSLIRAAIPLQFVGMSAGTALASRIIDGGASFDTVVVVAAVISLFAMFAVAPLGRKVRLEAC